MLLVQQILSKNFRRLAILLNVSARVHSLLLDVLYPDSANIFVLKMLSAFYIAATCIFKSTSN